MAKIIKLPKLEQWQRDVYDQAESAGGTGKVFVVKAKRQVGKSILAVCLLIKYALTSKCVSLCMEPTLTQSRRVFKQVCDFLNGSGAISGANAQLLEIQFVNGSEIIFKSAEQREALRGYSVSGICVIDEAAFIDKDIFQIVYPMVDVKQAPMLIVSTPLFCSGEFYELYMRGINGDTRVTSYDWSTYDTSVFLSPEKLEYYRDTMSPLKFRSEYLGEFIAEGSYIFGDISGSIKGFSDRPSVYAGIDWGAGNGNDFTTVVMMDAEGCVTKIWSTKDMDSVQQIDVISGLLNAEPGLKSVMVEMNSIGKIYYDQLKRKITKPLKGFYTTNESKRNIIERLVTAFLTNTITIPNDYEMIKELQHYNIEKTAKGYTYNGADGVHDDYVVALAICYENMFKGSTSGRMALV